MFPYPILFEASDTNYAQFVIVAFISAIFLLPVWLCILLRYYDRLVEWWEDLFGFGPINASYSAETTTKTTAKKTGGTWGKKLDEFGLYPDERHAPPRATFFERVSGEERIEDGPWEELYLTARELTGWENKKRKLKLASAENNTKKAETDQSGAFLEQNDSYTGYRG